MDNRHKNKYDSYGRIGDFNSKYATELATITEYSPEQKKFNIAVNGIQTASQAQEQLSGVSFDSTDTLKLTMAQTVIKYSLRGSVLAKQTGNTTLAGQLNEPVTYISAADKTDAVNRATDMRNTLNNNLATLTNVSAANIGEIDDAIKAYAIVQNAPTENVQASKAAGTDVLPGFFSDADTAAENMYDLVYSYFETDNSTMVDEMGLAMSIINNGIRHTVVDFLVIADEDSSAIAGATITDTSNDKTYTTDYKGDGDIATHKSGHFTFSISAAGRLAVNFGADIKRGTHNNFSVRMVKG